MEILRAIDTDWRRVREIRLRSLADEPDAFGSTLAREEAFSEGQWRARLTGAAATFLACEEGRDVGLATGAPYEGRPGMAGLFGMWVAPGARGRGVGDRLVEAVIAWAREGDFERLFLEVADGNDPAIRLYERHGFLRTGRLGTLPPPREHVKEHERVLELHR